MQVMMKKMRNWVGECVTRHAFKNDSLRDRKQKPHVQGVFWVNQYSFQYSGDFPFSIASTSWNVLDRVG